MIKRSVVLLLLFAAMFAMVPSDAHANPPPTTSVSAKLTGSTSGLLGGILGRYIPAAARQPIGNLSPSDCEMSVHNPHLSSYYLRRHREYRVKSSGNVQCHSPVPLLVATVALQQKFGKFWYNADKETFTGTNVLWGEASAHDACTKDTFRTRGEGRVVDVDDRVYSVRELDTRWFYNPCDLP